MIEDNSLSGSSIAALQKLKRSSTAILHNPIDANKDLNYMSARLTRRTPSAMSIHKQNMETVENQITEI
jgi:hypothetical protein